MSPTEMISFIILVVIIFAVVWWQNPVRRNRATWERSMNRGGPAPKAFRATILETRQPTSDTTCLGYAISQYRDDYWARLYWLDGHPTNADLKEKDGVNGRTLQLWEYFTGVSLGEAMAADSERARQTFDHHMQSVIRDLEEKGWQVIDGSTRVVPGVPDVHGDTLTVISLRRPSS